MFLLRKEQVAALDKVALTNFADRILAYLRENYPDETADMEDGEIREMAEYGVEQARQYDITKEVDVCGYIECMLLLGRDFDEDPALPWAGKILRDEDLDAAQKVEAIECRARETST